jgi:hypothetical protein
MLVLSTSVSISSQKLALDMAILTPAIVKGVEELVNEFETMGSNGGFLSCMIAILYFASIYGLQKLGTSTVFRPVFRGIIADYAYVVSLDLFVFMEIRSREVWLITRNIDRNHFLGWILAHSRPP